MNNPIDFFKKNEPENSCVNCNHRIIQDEDSGKFYHEHRDTKDACLIVDSKKNIECKCVSAKPKKIIEVEPEAESVEQEDILNKTNNVERVPENFSQPKPLPENPINFVLDYLLEKRKYAVSDANLILDVCKNILIDSVKKGE